VIPDVVLRKSLFFQSLHHSHTSHQLFTEARWHA
jgi:hypothetical protein